MLRVGSFWLEIWKRGFWMLVPRELATERQQGGAPHILAGVGGPQDPLDSRSQLPWEDGAQFPVKCTEMHGGLAQWKS